MSDTPQLSELDTLRLEAAMSRAETMQLRVEAMQQELQRRVDTFNTRFAGLQRDGYVLSRQPDGSWIYQPVATQTHS